MKGKGKGAQSSRRQQSVIHDSDVDLDTTVDSLNQNKESVSRSELLKSSRKEERKSERRRKVSGKQTEVVKARDVEEMDDQPQQRFLPPSASLQLKSKDMSRYLIVGLGNTTHPGTRHNVGMMAINSLLTMITKLSASIPVQPWEMSSNISGHIANAILSPSRLKALISGQPPTSNESEPAKDLVQVFFFKPKGYMNFSGTPVSAACRALKIRPSNLLILHDDLDKQLGTVTFKPKGSASGHNGLRSVEASLKSQDYPRLRIGIGRPQNRDLVQQYVLEKFALDEREELQEEVYPQVLTHVAKWLSDSEASKTSKPSESPSYTSCETSSRL